MRSYTDTMFKLQKAINAKGEKILVDKTQFYSEKRNCIINMYEVKKSYIDAETGKTKKITLFSSSNNIHIVLFLRNYWFMMNNQPVPEVSDRTPNKDEFNRKWNVFLDTNDIKL